MEYQRRRERTMAETVVMLVDDEVPFVETMTKRLTRRNLIILSAYSGQEALEKLKEHKDVDVVILDVKMPGMDGIETLREIKREHPLVEVIMLTGHATVETAIEGMKLGAFDYLMKPCEVEQLVAKVQEAKAKKSQHERKIMEARIREITSRRGLD
jgi:DNA-binding NtrC family response regulator